MEREKLEFERQEAERLRRESMRLKREAEEKVRREEQRLLEERRAIKRSAPITKSRMGDDFWPESSAKQARKDPGLSRSV